MNLDHYFLGIFGARMRECSECGAWFEPSGAFETVCDACYLEAMEQIEGDADGE